MTDNHLPNRRSIRLKEYDYSQAGAYFITVCTFNRRCLFGKVVDAAVQLNAVGEIVSSEWLRSAEMRAEVMLDVFVVMPNHVHGIIFIDGSVNTALTLPRADANRAGPHLVGTIINGFKAAATRRIRALNGIAQEPVWQRDYYEHIIRNERRPDAIREYIANNPANWANDRENPTGVRPAGVIADWRV